MLDESTSAFLNVLNGLCDGENYKIFAEEDFGVRSENENGVTVGETIRFLSEEGYIAVKYAEGGMYCLKVLPKARAKEQDEEKKREEERFFGLAQEKSAFYGSFLGGFLGSVLFALFFLLCFFLSNR
ncbi:MAG: hypothetical protein IIX01_00580 [Clostridia bacterium]|nr:hypothetical protein [Clostridia bacterium]